jgi:hypothetical protein
MSLGRTTYALLESDNLVVCQGISLGNHGYQVNFGMQPAHEFDVDLLKAVTFFE